MFGSDFLTESESEGRETLEETVWMVGDADADADDEKWVWQRTAQEGETLSRDIRILIRRIANILLIAA